MVHESRISNEEAAARVRRWTAQFSIGSAKRMRLEGLWVEFYAAALKGGAGPGQALRCADIGLLQGFSLRFFGGHNSQAVLDAGGAETYAFAAFRGSRPEVADDSGRPLDDDEIAESGVKDEVDF